MKSKLPKTNKKRPLKVPHNRIVPKAQSEIEKGLNDVIEAREQSRFSKRLVRRDIVERDVCIIRPTSKRAQEILDGIRELEKYFEKSRIFRSKNV